MRILPRTGRGRVLVVLALVVLLFFVSTARLFVWPPTDRPVHVDAVVALGGDPGQRRAKEAIQLTREGYAPVAVISLGGAHTPCPTAPPHVKVICFHPNPLNTRGEAEHVGKLVAQYHWTKIIVVSERSQSTRARLLFKRCTGATLVMVPVEDVRARLFYDVAYEWAALLKALVVQRSC